MKREERLLIDVNNILEEEGIDLSSNTPEQNIEYILKALESSKDILSPLYSFKTRERGGLIGKIKSKIQNKIINTVINVIEKQSQKQQKFNELVFKYLQELQKQSSKNS